MDPSSSSSDGNFNVEEWRSIVSRVLAAWSGYQLAIEHNTGGDETKEKHEWFCNELTTHVHETKALKAESLEEWMESILYADFDLVLEDDSIFPTSHLLIELHGYLKANNRVRLEQLLSTLPSEETIKNVKRASRKEGGDDDEESLSGDSDMELAEEGEKVEEDDAAQQSKSERRPRTVTDDDGWTTIVPRK